MIQNPSRDFRGADGCQDAKPASAMNISQDVCGEHGVSSVQTTHSYGYPVRRHPRVSPSCRNAQHPRCSMLRWFRPWPGSPGAPLLRHLNVLRGVHCYKGNFGLARCRSALRWPPQLLEVKYDDYAGPIGPLPSYSPFPGEMNLNPIDDRGVGPAPSGDILIAIREPTAHLRRDLEVRNFRLADFVAVTK